MNFGGATGMSRVKCEPASNCVWTRCVPARGERAISQAARCYGADYRYAYGLCTSLALELVKSIGGAVGAVGGRAAIRTKAIPKAKTVMAVFKFLLYR